MVHQLTVKDLKSWLDAKKSGLILLDVREPWEVATCALENITNIPMGQIANRLQELDKSKLTVVVCHHGRRSQQVALYMDQSGFENIYNLQGGVDAWAREIDPSMPVY